MRAFTIILLGTGQYASKKSSLDSLGILHRLADYLRTRHPSKEGEVYAVSEGIGSKFDPTKVELMTRSGLVENKESDIITKLYNTFFGLGAEQIIERLLRILTFAAGVSSVGNYQPKPIDVINLVGFSRGAVLALALSKLLFNFKDMDESKVFEKTKVNVFAMDPVAGHMDFGRYTKDVALSNNVLVLEKNLNDVIISHSADEQLSSFTQLKLRFPLEKNVCYLRFPGIHVEQTKGDNLSGRIVTSLVVSFLHHHHGSCFLSTLPGLFHASEAQMLDCYTKLKLKEQGYGLRAVRTMPTNILAKLPWAALEPRHFSQKGFDQPSVLKTILFVNDHHYFLFNKKYHSLVTALTNEPQNVLKYVRRLLHDVNRDSYDAMRGDKQGVQSLYHKAREHFNDTTTFHSDGHEVGYFIKRDIHALPEQMKIQLYEADDDAFSGPSAGLSPLPHWLTQLFNQLH